MDDTVIRKMYAFMLHKVPILAMLAFPIKVWEHFLPINYYINAPNGSFNTTKYDFLNGRK